MYNNQYTLDTINIYIYIYIHNMQTEITYDQRMPVFKRVKTCHMSLLSYSVQSCKLPIL